jgi:hypothetical protein
MNREGLMPGKITMTAAESAELQRLYAALPEAIAEAVEALPVEQLSGAAVATLLEGDAEVDTIISRIRQITEQKVE